VGDQAGAAGIDLALAELLPMQGGPQAALAPAAGASVLDDLMLDHLDGRWGQQLDHLVRRWVESAKRSFELLIVRRRRSLMVGHKWYLPCRTRGRTSEGVSSRQLLAAA
jgi:hypothetical protein